MQNLSYLYIATNDRSSMTFLPLMNRPTIRDLDQARYAVFILLVLYVAGPYGASYLDGHASAYSTPLQTALELYGVVIFSIVFAVSWGAYSEGRKLSATMLAITSLCMALLGFFSIISIPENIFSLPSDDFKKSTYFNLIGQLILAITLLILSSMSLDAIISRCRSVCWLMVGLAGIGVYVFLVFFHLRSLPEILTSNKALTLFGMIVEYGIITLYAMSAVLLYRQLHAPADARAWEKRIALDQLNLMVAAVSMTLSGIFFSMHPHTGSTVVLLSPTYKVIAAIFIYRAVISINITAPYKILSNVTERLATAAKALEHNQSRMMGIIQTANDAIITTDEAQKIIFANPAAATMFRTTVENMQGHPLEKFIPPRHRTNYREYVGNFGQIKSPVMNKGKIYAEYHVVGLKADGEEFPIEASISSLKEDKHRFYTVILRDITKRKQAQHELAQSHAKLSQLSAALQTIREEERKHIARELHDDLGQLLAALRIDLSLLLQQSIEETTARKLLLSMDRLVISSISSLRRIAADLRPRALDEGGLFFALLSLRKEFSARYGIDCTLHADEYELALDDIRSTAIFRIIQESLNNVARHADAKKVSITLKRKMGNLIISIEDDGRGITDDDTRKSLSFGLIDMRERVRAIKGKIVISGNAGQGTRIDVTLPI